MGVRSTLLSSSRSDSFSTTRGQIPCWHVMKILIRPWKRLKMLSGFVNVFDMHFNRPLHLEM